MIVTFYIIIFSFIFSEIYHFFNKKRLDIIFKNKDIDTIRKSDGIFYILKILSIIWPIIGLFSSFIDIFLLLIVFNLIKFIFYHISETTYNYYIRILPFINITLYLIILYYKFIH